MEMSKGVTLLRTAQSLLTGRTIPHLTWEKGKITRKHHTKSIHKRSTILERSVKILLKGLNIFNATNLTLNSDGDQDTLMFGSYERSLTYWCIIS